MISLAVDRSLGTSASFGPLFNVERLALSVSVSEGSSGSGAKMCSCELSLHLHHAVTCRQMACFVPCSGIYLKCLLGGLCGI